MRKEKMRYEIQNEAKKRNLIVIDHKPKPISTISDPTYTKSKLGTNGVRIECKENKNETRVNIGFSDDHKKDFERDYSDWNTDGKIANLNWANTVITSVSDFFEIFDNIKNNWKQIITISNTLNNPIDNVIAPFLHNCLSTENEALLNRNLFDLIDGIITQNDPLPEKNWREHVVPCKVLLNEAKRIFLNGGTAEDIAEMLHNNLVIVNIHESDARRLDGEMGLRESMPEGWEFGDCIFARLDAAGIDY